jgi:integrase
METYNIVEAWLDNVAFSHSKSPGTHKRYLRCLKEFCAFINATPEQIKEEYDKIDEKVFKRKYAERLRCWISNLAKHGYAPLTIADHATAIRSFFKYNDLALAFVPMAKNHVTYHNRDIEREEVQQILAASAPRERAFYAMMYQGGFRPDTLVKLKLKDLEPDFSEDVIPCKVNVREEATKGQYASYFSFIGEEAVKYLKAYLSTRTDNTDRKHPRPNTGPNDYVFTDQGISKPAYTKSISGMFMRTLKALKAKGTINYEVRNNKPSELRLYSLRKFFSKHAGQMGSDEKDYLMGHTLPGARGHYMATDPEHYRKLYAEKAMPFLRFETGTPLDVDKALTPLNEAIAKKDEEIAAMKREIAEIRETMNRQTELMKRYMKEEGS